MRDQFSTTVRSFLTPIIKFLDDPEITEIMVNSPAEIWVERGGRIERTAAAFPSDEALMSAVNNISQFVKRRIDEESPTMDARLPDGSRIHVILPPCARKGICMAIRKFSKETLTIDKLIGFGSITRDMIDFLTAAVFLKKNIIVSGGTGSGKTSLLNAVAAIIPSDERIVVIEDSAELQLQQDHVLPLEARVADRRGRGEVSIRELLRSTLRLRPDRIIVGEIRAGEALDLLQAMNTGHGGSMGTIHANSPLDALSRLETLTLFAGVDLPLKVIRSQVASAMDLIVQTSRFHDGSRKISHISEVLALGDDGNYRVSDLWTFKQKGLDADHRVVGAHAACGKKPSFYDEIHNAGQHLSAEIFTAAAVDNTMAGS